MNEDEHPLEVLVEEHPLEVSVRNTTRDALMFVAAFTIALFFGGVAAVTLIASHLHDTQIASAADARARTALAKSIQAQRQINGNEAMIFAVCRAFHRRDVRDADKWKAVTDVEFHYRRPNNNETDAAYHAARRKALAEVVKKNTAIVNFNCLKGMERAFFDGSQFTSSSTGVPRKSPSSKHNRKP